VNARTRAGLWLLGFPSLAQAHGFGQRYDLPVPLGLYITGAAATVLFSFVVIAWFSRSRGTTTPVPRFNLFRFRMFQLLTAHWLIVTLQTGSVLLFLLLLAAGLYGVQEPFANITPTLVWVIWWVGLAYICGLLGNLWLLLNPWNNLYQLMEWLLQRLRPGCRTSLQWQPPGWVGVWPALLMFLLFVWLELIVADSDTPATLAKATLIYSLFTWGGMALTGREHWLQHGEAFYRVFYLLGRFAPLQYRPRAQGEPDQPSCLYLQLPGSGLRTAEPLSLSRVCFVILMLASVTFDGLLATPFWAALVQGALYSELLRPMLLLLQSVFGDAIAVITGLGLLAFVALFVLLFLIFCALMHRVAGIDRNMSVLSLAGYFVLTLIPIALAKVLWKWL